MTREEIVRLAFNIVNDTKTAMLLANDMAKFIEGENFPVDENIDPYRSWKPWAAEEIELLIKLDSLGVRRTIIAARFNRTVSGITGTLHRIKKKNILSERQK